LPDLLRDLTLNARNKDYSPPAIGSFWNDIVWRRRSYVAFVIDEPAFQFRKYKDGGGIFFDPSKQNNHSFFDAKDTDVDVSTAHDGSAKISGVYCINHMKGDDQKWDDLGNGLPPGKTAAQSYKFSLGYEAVTNPGKIMTFDPDGTNVGPPPPP
jgi:hypothetical protein